MKGVGKPPSGRDTIWSPWRMEYIEGTRPEGCEFCVCAESDPAEDAEHYILHRGRGSFIVLNLWPYNNGHAMVCPYRHITDLSELTDEESLEMIHLSRRLIEAYRKAMRAEGVNVGMNLGRISGGSIEHLHLHLVPRWTGDANFMPVIGQTKVVVEMLSDTYTRLKEEVDKWAEDPTGA